MSNFRISSLKAIKVPKRDYRILISKGNDTLSAYQIELSNFQIPTATETRIGSIGTDYVQNGYNYPLSIDEEGRGFVYIPWTDYHLQSAWYEPEISSLIFRIKDKSDDISVSVSALFDFYYGDDETVVLEEDTKKFSVKLDGKNLPYDGYLISSYGGDEGDVIYVDCDTKKSHRDKVLRFDLFPCENQKDIEKTDMNATVGDIEVDLSNEIVYEFSTTGKQQKECSDIYEFCKPGRFMYNSYTHKLFYNQGDLIYCCRKQREDD